MERSTILILSAIVTGIAFVAVGTILVFLRSFTAMVLGAGKNVCARLQQIEDTLEAHIPGFERADVPPIHMPRFLTDREVPRAEPRGR